MECLAHVGNQDILNTSTACRELLIYNKQPNENKAKMLSVFIESNNINACVKFGQIQINFKTLEHSQTCTACQC